MTTEIASSIRQALAEAGPMTALSLASYLDLPRSKVAAVLVRLRKQREVYIRSWRRDEPDRRVRDNRPRAVYSLGANPDAVKPAPQPARVKWNRWAAKRRVAPEHKHLITSVFDLGYRVDAR